MRVEQQIEFEAKDDADAIRIARERLGADAVILSSRQERIGGFLGFFKRRVFWVKAGILADDPQEAAKEKRDRLNAFQQMLDVKKAVTGHMAPSLEVNTAFLSGAQKAEYYAQPTPLDQAKAAVAYTPAPIANPMQQQVEELRQALTKVLERLEGKTAGEEEKIDKQEIKAIKEIKKEEILPKTATNIEELEKNLTHHEVDISLKEDLIREYSHMAEDAAPIDWLSSRITVAGADVWGALGGSRVMFVGPTGVGKTTTIAKIAAINSLWEGRKVVMITSDTYRIAAVDQLRTYARILGVPLEVAFEPKEIKDIVKKHADADLILLDTAGRSHKDAKRVEELIAINENFAPSSVQLVLAANLKYRDMLDVIDRMGVVPMSSILFTKMDETSTYGTILNIVEDFGLPLSFFTVGQNVPNDIEVASKARLSSLLLGGDRLGGN